MTHISKIYEQLPPDSLEQELLIRKQKLEELIAIKKKVLKQAPDGKLRISKNKGTIQYYLVTESAKIKPEDVTEVLSETIKSDDVTKSMSETIKSADLTESMSKTENKIEPQSTQKAESKIAQKKYPAKNGKYLSKSKMDYIKSLAQKDYNSKILPQLQEQLDAVNLALATLGKTNLSQLYENFPLQRKCLVEPITLTTKEYNARWQKIEYQPKTFSQDAPELFTAKGERVRSKSEIIIADTLARQEICYRYEFPLDLGNHIVHPDFYCLNTRTRQEFIWEHFGMMDDFNYACSATKKIKAYQEAGYFPGENFIITMETTDSPINTKQVEEIIEKYLK